MELPEEKWWRFSPRTKCSVRRTGPRQRTVVSDWPTSRAHVNWSPTEDCNHCLIPIKDFSQYILCTSTSSEELPEVSRGKSYYKNSLVCFNNGKRKGKGLNFETVCCNLLLVCNALTKFNYRKKYLVLTS